MRGLSLFSSRAARKVEVAGKSLKRITTMRDIEVIDSELRLLFRAWRVARGAWRVARGAWRVARGAWRACCATGCLAPR